MKARAHTTESVSGQRLSLAEIGRVYPNEWVALVDVDAPEMKLAGGVIFAHHPDRDTLRKMALSMRHGAIVWTGRIRSWRPAAAIDHVD
jgi:hypothetical protein